MSPLPSTSAALAVALNSSAAADQASLGLVALNLAQDGKAPDWVELLPAGVDVVGRDGRHWTNPDPQALAAASDPAANPMPIDWEHATDVRAGEGLEAPAAAWVDQLEVRDGAIWGHVEWTPRGAEQVANKEYRFLSPVFAFDKTSGRIKQLKRAGLTNTPNLHLTALNREEARNREPSEDNLDLATLLRSALGLPTDASEAAIVAAATTAHAANKAGVDLTKYAPRSDLDTALNRATAAETKLAARETADAETGIKTALDEAQAAGKITPASRGSYEAMCRVEGGLERFKALVATLPKITGAASTGAEKKLEETATNGEHGLSDEELAVCRTLGQDPAEFAKAKKGA